MRRVKAPLQFQRVADHQYGGHRFWTEEKCDTRASRGVLEIAVSSGVRSEIRAKYEALVQEIYLQRQKDPRRD